MLRSVGFWLRVGVVLCSIAFAGSASAVQFGMGVWQNGSYLGGVTEGALGCITSGGGDIAQCQGGAYSIGDLSVDSWNMNVDADPVVSGIVAVTNNAATTQDFTLIFTLAVSPAVVPSSLIGGSIQGGVTDNNGDGALLAALVGDSMYRARIDGATVASLYDDPTSVAAGAFLSASLPTASFGTPIPSQPGPAALTDIGIRLKFSLSPGDSASFTSNFVVIPVPEPSVAVMLGLGLGLLGRARLARRR